MNSIRFLLLSLLKISGVVLYPSKLNWIGARPKSWDEVSLVLFLNHTSLFEFVYAVALPFSFLDKLSKNLVMPVASTTLEKPFTGFLFKNLAPHTISLTRKRDESWKYFLDRITEDKICIFMPEGQMKRRNGLDKNGRPMKVKTGVYDLMQKYRGKNMVLVYGHGLHHVFAPGDKFPRVFKKVEADIEFLSVNDYLTNFEELDQPADAVATDLQKRRDQYCKS